MNIERFKSDIIPLRQKLFIVALKIVNDEEDAKDTVQETFLKLWNEREQLGNAQNPEGYAMQTAKNICIDKLRAKRETVEANDFSLGSHEDSPYADLEKSDSLAIVKQIIEQLPELQKTIIRMRDMEGYELQEIADITGTQISAVTVNLSRARMKVRDQYARIVNYKYGKNE
ncbi:MAG: sigma-70 family RNA polymerase sigma factor [Tannerella sp.]|jgi:RNA polymerase sigma-70 factor (ECF subfamily)|nr:sigma-70 family RNA polymerase sigma factor [Tannerella sp.]